MRCVLKWHSELRTWVQAGVCAVEHVLCLQAAFDLMQSFTVLGIMQVLKLSSGWYIKPSPRFRQQ